ncbi:MAG: SPOR domain-containing protein [Prevotellaceae bacterium]|jgi:nucleoid DNA-binding protein|nr:SPOR domain-containing protein [Prevotellaceae bacterium]
MEEIAKLLVELLKTHNRVSIPGLGAFIATPQPATFDRKSKSIAPPSKKVTFSKEETWNDGLLEQLYAEKYEISIEAARDKIKHFIIDIRFELDAVGKVAFPGLGTLKQGQTKEMSFGLSKNVNLQSDSYGLSEMKISGGLGKGAKSNSSGKSSMGAISLIALAVMVALVVAIGLYLYLSGGENANNILDIDSENANEERITLSDPETSTKEYIVHTPKATTQSKPQAAPAATNSKPQQSTTASSASKQSVEFCIIVTSLNTRDAANKEAETYVKMGYKNSHVIDSGNSKFRVSVGCYKSYDAAKKELSIVQRFKQDAWILEVKK